MKALLVYPKYPDTFWSFKHALKFISKRLLEKRRRYFHLWSVRYNLRYLDAPFKTLVILGIQDRARFYYWKLVAWSLFRRPRLLPMAIEYLVYGFHFRKVFGKHLVA